MAKATDYRENVYKMGIPVRVREIEIEVRAYHRDYPELFLSATPPQLLRPELRNGASSNGAEPTKRPAGSSGYSIEQKERRQRTADLLDWIAKKARTADDLKQRGTDMRGLHQLVQYGYLKQRNGAFSRTSKAWVVNSWTPAQRAEVTTAPPRQKKRPSAMKKRSAPNVKAQRQRTADYLAQYDTETPRLIPSAALGAYVRRGYLREKGDGYLRTAKEFIVDKKR
jgi:hypothetical protein